MFSLDKHSVPTKVLMVEPRTFHANPETLSSNAFQSQITNKSREEIQARALLEFIALRQLLEANRMEVILKQEPLGAETPDALFPNNWFCQLPHQDFYIFPMEAENRRREVHSEWLKEINSGAQIFDLRKEAGEGEFLEGTGSLILDHENRRVYAALSSRTHHELLKKFSQRSGYKICAFEAFDENAKPYYHTNVIMALGEKNVLLCEESVGRGREELLRSLKATEKNIVSISRKQVLEFAGNALRLNSQDGRKFWILSSRAFHSLTPDQKSALEKEAQFLHSPLPTIEDFGGGSARCMLAEIF
jgi:hypothetical protein